MSVMQEVDCQLDASLGEKRVAGEEKGRNEVKGMKSETEEEIKQSKDGKGERKENEEEEE